MWALISAIILAVLFMAAIACAISAVKSARTPQGAVAWVVFLLVAPHFGVPLFLFFGQSRYNGYVVARRSSEAVAAQIVEFGEAHAARHLPDGLNTKPFERVAEMPVVSGNDAKLLVDGDDTFGAIFAAIEAAQDYILVQFYMFHDDELGRAMQNLLIRKAGQGVPVRLIYDDIGSTRLPKSYLDKLRDAGVRAYSAHSIRGPHSRFQLNFRNHRKIVIVDGEVGFIGGLNVGDEYMGRDTRFGPWRDTHVQLRGPMVTQLQLVFAEDWHWATHEDLTEPLNWEPRDAGDYDGLVIPTGPADEIESGSLYFCAAIDAAKDRVWIASPYFVPEIDILTSLKLAAMRGADVRILVPEGIDHRIVWLAAFAYFDEVIQAGVQIWRYQPGFMHQKVVLVDETITSIGTLNMDNRSCRLNFEATAMIFDSRMAKQVAAMLEKDFERSTRMTALLADQPLRRQIGARVARLFGPLL
ncbi:cardiolipin synthase [Qingshengfaniella alkalisoli]|uniref:Cardiolipin synthase n=1 Tax=Qingshengfaniella alkalisoli TaxID=2599296 RepID=A0A5B8IB03_9RHOB|nr:cardiolipin synthase [Qingshengfaniella alkalisoli]QDY71279.1 cardiolipin synthase [Qingshengfaniella alkalisoli]